ncbi:MAG: hypothetical protein ABIL39_08860 [candidate division WOR-3 bacterium]
MIVFWFLIAYTLPGVLTQGDAVFYYDASSLGLGGNTTVLENGLNPAGMCLADAISLKLGWVFFECREKRGLRVYDNYGNNIGIATIAVNQITILDLAPFSIMIPLKNLRFGVKYYKLYDFGYSFHHEYRDNFYQLVKIVDDSYAGGVKALSPGLGLSYKSLNIAVAQDLIYGSAKREMRIYYPHGEDSLKKEEWFFSTTTSQYGLILNISYHFRLGYFFEKNFSASVQDTTLLYPAGHNLGIYFQPPYRVPTKFVAELNYKLWRKRILSYKFGVEHSLLSDYAVRYGFCLLPDYNQPAIWTTSLTLGVGGNFKNYHFDFGFMLSKRDYANTDFGGLGIAERQFFDETQNHFVFSFGFKL